MQASSLGRKWQRMLRFFSGLSVTRKKSIATQTLLEKAKLQVREFIAQEWPTRPHRWAEKPHPQSLRKAGQRRTILFCQLLNRRSVKSTSDMAWSNCDSLFLWGRVFLSMEENKRETLAFCLTIPPTYQLSISQMSTWLTLIRNSQCIQTTGWHHQELQYTRTLMVLIRTHLLSVIKIKIIATN